MIVPNCPGSFRFWATAQALVYLPVAVPVQVRMVFAVGKHWQRQRHPWVCIEQTLDFFLDDFRDTQCVRYQRQ